MSCVAVYRCCLLLLCVVVGDVGCYVALALCIVVCRFSSMLMCGACCALCVVCCLSCVACCWLVAVGCRLMLFVVWSLLIVVVWSLLLVLIGSCVLRVACMSVCAVWCLLRAYWLFVVGCVLLLRLCV